MKRNRKALEEYYTSDKFMEANFHIEEDSPWKVELLLPFMEIILNEEDKKDWTILDVGGGSGLVMKGIAVEVEEKHGKKVKQMAADLSPGYLEVQKRVNPELKNTFCCSVESTPLRDKEVDVILLIDVLEHLADPLACYRELKRIANYVLLKVPLEKNLSVYLLDLLLNYRKKRAVEGGVGHVNFYALHGLKKELQENLGVVMGASTTDVFSYLLGSEVRRRTLSIPRILYCHLARLFYKISPRIASYIFNDFAIILVKTYCTKEGNE